MSAVSRHEAAAAASPSLNATLRVRWAVGVNGDAALEIAAAVADGSCAVTARSEGDRFGAAMPSVRAAAGAAIRDRASGLLHLDAPGLLRATVDETTGALLFAQTPLFRDAGIPGGRYEIAQSEWRHAPASNS